MNELDLRVRQTAFDFLDQLRSRSSDDLLSRADLIRGFVLDGHRVPLVGPEGIFKPRVLRSMPLSIFSKSLADDVDRPYDDVLGSDGLLQYKYRGSDAGHPDNTGLREAMQRRVPLVYFVAIKPGRYLAAYPVFIVGDRPSQLTFTVSIDDRQFASLGNVAEEPVEVAVRRRYVTQEVQQRVHQKAFRERVLDAYQRNCAVCRLKRNELLDAAHIIGDAEDHGAPVVPNGIALCKLHHSAFDANIMGVRPDFVIEIREDVLREIDGPMLIHGLQGWNGKTLRVPRQYALRPDPDRLAERYDAFRSATR